MYKKLRTKSGWWWNNSFASIHLISILDAPFIVLGKLWSWEFLWFHNLNICSVYYKVVKKIYWYYRLIKNTRYWRNSTEIITLDLLQIEIDLLYFRLYIFHPVFWPPWITLKRVFLMFFYNLFAYKLFDILFCKNLTTNL